MTDTTKYYWFPETDAALLQYREEPDQHKRDVIYKNHLNEPFLRLSESIVNIIRPRLAFIKEDTDELKYIVIAHLLEFIPKYDPSRGTGFTFFSLVGKHFLMNSNMRAEKVFKLRAETLVPLEEDEELCSSHAYSYEDDIPYDDGLGGRIHPMLQYYKNNISIWNEKYGNEMYEYILDNIDLEMAEPLLMLKTLHILQHNVNLDCGTTKEAIMKHLPMVHTWIA